MSEEFAIILAGGKGTRLWPLSRGNYPKQFVPFIAGQSLFQLTVKRLTGYFKSRNILIVTSDSYKFHIINQIAALRSIKQRDKIILEKNILLEPCPKSTAPAVMLAIKSLLGNHDDDTFFVFPSDHIIKPRDKFFQALRRGANLVQRGQIAIFGIKPSKPCAGYGYIVAGNKMKYGRKVIRFVEKPSLSRLKELMEKKVYWNAGIFAFKPKVFFKELSAFAPDIFKFSFKKYPDFLKDFSAVPSDSIDYAIMQKTQRAVLVEFKGQWSDLGSWDNVREYFSKGKGGKGNFSIGRAEFLDSRGCFSFSKDKLISFLGLKDVLVIEESDSILIMKKGDSDKVKELTKKLRGKQLSQVEDSLTVYRPWGYYTILKEKKNYKVKEIGIYPKKSISLQRHKRRSEHWNVVDGRASITLGKNKITIKKNESIFVPKGRKHKVYNPTGKILKIIEVQIGNYLGEDDIMRFDSY